MITDNRFLQQSDSRLDFFRCFLQEPQQVGSVFPSSRFLERRVVTLAALRKARTVVELGPGTGGITNAVLRELPPSSNLLSIEINHRFVSILRRCSDPRLLIHHGCAGNLREILHHYQLPQPEVVISGIPFSTISRNKGQRIIEEIHTALSPNGYFIAYQVHDHVSKLGRSFFGNAEVHRVFYNIPPLRIYRWRKKTCRNDI